MTKRIATKNDDKEGAQWIPSFTMTEVGPSVCPGGETGGGYYGDLSTSLALNNLVPSISFDFDCPSVQSKIPDRTCSKCRQYFPSVKVKKSHWKFCKLEVEEDSEEEDFGDLWRCEG